VRNAGLTNTAYVYGDIDTASFIGKLGVRPTVSTSSATVDGEGIPGDLAVEFTSPEARSLLTRLPAAFRHASVFRPGGVGAWTYWVLIALVAIGAPLALARALVRAGDDDADPPLPSTPSS
jgi:hypothetical protein